MIDFRTQHSCPLLTPFGLFIPVSKLCLWERKKKGDWKAECAQSDVYNFTTTWKINN